MHHDNLPTSTPDQAPHQPPSRRAPGQRSPWNPYLVGIGIGLLSWAAFAIVDKPIGMSTQIAAASGAAARPILGDDTVFSNAYWSAKATPKWDYGMLFLVGTFLGALASSLLSREWRAEAVPTVWRERFGPSVAKRLLWAFLGGILILYGARLADGCTSGHGISGSLQLALGSWVFFLTLFLSGVITAQIMFRKTR